ncbi:protein translocase subunit SecF [Granulosicoccus antarcticus]|nr:protein translocase subunit SecF [Granulosicoccus antarcticus]
MHSLFEGTNFDFMGRQKLATWFSGITMVLSFVAIFGMGLNLGVDFTGGYTMELAYQESPDLPTIRTALETAELGDTLVQNFGTAKSVLVRIAPQEGLAANTISQTVLTALKTTSDSSISVRSVDFVGPQVGEELREKGGLSILIALGAIAVYVWMRYEKKFAVGAILATVHDIIVTIGFFALFGIEFNLTVLAALLAVIGYSLNDTIVVYDRIRENFRKIRDASPEQVMNDAINQTLSRTLITSGTTLMVVVSMLLLGGPTIHGFALALLIGIGYGTYSSIFVASMTVKAMGISREDLLPVEKEGTELDSLP